MEQGEFYTSDEALKLNMVNAILPPKIVLPTAVEEAKKLSSFPPTAFKIIKQNRVEQVEGRIRKNMKKKAELFISCWYSPESRKLLKEAMEKF
jgi:enoyl-CoA hydratase/carnithine racemase